MKKLILLLLLTAGVLSQPITRIDSTIFVSKSGGGDSTYWMDLGMRYAFVWISVTDTDGVSGTHYTDSIKAYNITKPRSAGTDSSFSPIDLWGRYGTTSNTWFTATSNAGATVEYWCYDSAIDKLYLVMANTQFITGRRVKITIRCVTR